MYYLQSTYSDGTATIIKFNSLEKAKQKKIDLNKLMPEARWFITKLI